MKRKNRHGRRRQAWADRLGVEVEAPQPVHKIKNRPEQDFQKLCIKTADLMWFPTTTPNWPHLAKSKVSRFLFHIPNGGARDAVEAAILKAMGVLPGVSDLFLSVPVWRDRRVYAGLYIEMKAGSNRMTPAQRTFQTLMELVGYQCTELSDQAGVDGFKRLIEDYFRGAEPVSTIPTA